MAQIVECEICLEECQEDNLEEHRQICMARFMFRCNICNGDYVSKEGLWNHLYLHGIADESKELHYQEVRTTYNLYQCALCNDQRGYQGNLYWKHVHEAHNDYFLWCSDCGKKFRSQKNKTDHDLTNCKVTKQMVNGGLDSDEGFRNVFGNIQDENTASFVNFDGIHENAILQLDPLQGELSCVPLEDSKRTHHVDKDLRNAQVDPRACSQEQETISFEQPLVDYNRRREELQLLAEIPLNAICSHCGKDFVSVDALSSHIESFHKPTMCNSCRKLFPSKQSAKYHELSCQHLKHVDSRLSSETIPQPHGQTSSSGLSDIVCHHCDKYYRSESVLGRHIERSHQPIVCSTCGDTLIGTTRLQYHKVKFHPEPESKCPHCSEKFQSKIEYLYHVSTHVIERKFSCKLCSRKYKYELTLKSHIRRMHS